MSLVVVEFCWNGSLSFGGFGFGSWELNPQTNTQRSLREGWRGVIFQPMLLQEVLDLIWDLESCGALWEWWRQFLPPEEVFWDLLLFLLHLFLLLLLGQTWKNPSAGHWMEWLIFTTTQVWRRLVQDGVGCCHEPAGSQFVQWSEMLRNLLLNFTMNLPCFMRSQRRVGEARASKGLRTCKDWSLIIPQRKRCLSWTIWCVLHLSNKITLVGTWTATWNWPLNHSLSLSLTEVMLLKWARKLKLLCTSTQTLKHTHLISGHAFRKSKKTETLIYIGPNPETYMHLNMGCSFALTSFRESWDCVPWCSNAKEISNYASSSCWQMNFQVHLDHIQA